MFELTADKFESFICKNSDRLALVSFRADWNPLDRAMRGVINDVEIAVGDQMALAEVDCSSTINLELQAHLGLSHIPALFFIFRNRVVDYKVGYSKVRLVGHVQQLLQIYSPYNPDPPKPIHPGPFPSGIVLPPDVEPDTESVTGPHGQIPLNSNLPTQQSPYGPRYSPGMPMQQPVQPYPVHPAQNQQWPDHNSAVSHNAPHPEMGFPGNRAFPNQPSAPKFGLIPHRLVVEQPKKSWWSRLLS